jgi:short-subunit dehydrogenase
MAKLDLNGATAIVTGASRGIGPYIARELAARGARVALVARSEGELEAVAAEIVASGAVAVAIHGDVTSRSARESIVAAAERRLGPIDVLVNNAGGDPQREFHNLGEDEIEDVLQLNLHAPLLLARLVLPGMLERGRGHVVNVSSMAGRTSFPYSEAYGAAKDGLIAFTRIWRNDYRGRGVSASTLILGPVGEAGVGARTADEVGMKLPPFLVPPARVGKAAARAIAKDKAEIAVLPGPGKLLRALMDRFPGMGPAMNRAAGVNQTMRRVADFREQQALSQRVPLARHTEQEVS